MPKTMTVINCAPTRMTRIINYVPKQKTTHVEAIALLMKDRWGVGKRKG